MSDKEVKVFVEGDSIDREFLPDGSVKVASLQVEQVFKQGMTAHQLAEVAKGLWNESEMLTTEENEADRMKHDDAIDRLLALVVRAQADAEESDKCRRDTSAAMIENVKKRLASNETPAWMSMAFDEWFSKTRWVQDEINRGELPATYLGWHRADVMRAEIERLRAALASKEDIK